MKYVSNMLHHRSVCPCFPLCSNKRSTSPPLNCPPPGRNWTARVKGELLFLSCLPRSLAHLCLVHHACPWNNAIWISPSLLPPLSTQRILNLHDVICLLMCSEYPLLLLNGSCYISLSSGNRVAKPDHISRCLLSILLLLTPLSFPLLFLVLSFPRSLACLH